MKRFQGGLEFEAHRLLYHSNLGLRVKKKIMTDSTAELVAELAALKGLPRYLSSNGTPVLAEGFAMCAGIEVDSLLKAPVAPGWDVKPALQGHLAYKKQPPARTMSRLR